MIVGFLNVEKLTMDLLYSIALYFFNPYWDPPTKEDSPVFILRKALMLEKFFLWSFCDLFTALSLLFLFYSIGKKIEQQREKKRQRSKNKKSSNLNSERPNYNTQSLIEILEEKSKVTADEHKSYTSINSSHPSQNLSSNEDVSPYTKKSHNSKRHLKYEKETITSSENKYAFKNAPP